MSKPTEVELNRLKKWGRDSESYHSEFDDILEEKLIALDPEWMEAMQEIYNSSRNERWCA